MRQLGFRSWVFVGGSAVLIAAALVATELADKPAAQRVESYGNLPLSFEPNRGQAAQQVKFLSRGPGYALIFTEDETIFAFKRSNPM